MKAIIEQLINLKKEGDYWDFKLLHHKEVGELLFDILCLSNSLSESDCYLIFGVDPDSFKVVGLHAVRPRTQADIIDFLSSAKFAGGKIPKVELTELTIEDQRLDILTIRKVGGQPFYLEKDYIFGNKRVSRGVIYSREGDRNTPMDSLAPVDRVEELWIRRFGLRDSPIQKFTRILSDHKKWHWDGIDSAHYSPDPDYTLKILENENLGAGNYWWGNIRIETPRLDELSLRFRNVSLENQVTGKCQQKCRRF